MDRDWRISNLYKIIDKNSKLVIFKPNAIQRVMNAETAPRKMILKPRQIGSTTNEVIKLLDYCIYHKNTTICIMAHEDSAIKKIFRIPRRAFNALPAAVRPELDRGGGSKYEMAFPKIRSLMYCDLESRGDTISRLHISEAAFVDYERYISTMQAVPVNGWITIESTPNGVGNWFYDKWQNDDSYAKLFFPWYMDAGYQLPYSGRLSFTAEELSLIKYAKAHYKLEISPNQIVWRRQKITELKDFFYQEYPEDPATCFLLSGGQVIDRLIIQKIMATAKKPISESDGITIFEPKRAGAYYAIGADPAEGVGGDYSHAVCYDIERRTEVASLRGQFKPVIFARKLKEFAAKYSHGHRWPLLAIERNNHGHAVLQELIEHTDYPNLFFAKEDAPGWHSNSITRPIMMDQLIDAVEDAQIKINDMIVLNELMTLINKNGKIEAATGKHDDAVIATAITLQMILQESAKVKLYENVRSSIIV